jgi:hypothetical protein
MRKSARVLGQKYGLTSQEMNFVLKEDGYLNGDTDNYSVTEMDSIRRRNRLP